jgi:hypothetical protein
MMPNIIEVPGTALNARPIKKSCHYPNFVGICRKSKIAAGMVVFRRLFISVLVE